MPTRAEILQQVRQSQRRIDRMDRELARDITEAYEAARRDLLADLVDAFSRLPDEPTPAQIRRLLSANSLIVAIEERVALLRQQITPAMDGAVSGATGLAHQSAVEELMALAEMAGVTDFVPLGLDPLLELTVRPAIEQIPAATEQFKNNLTAELRTRLARGDRMREITNALYGTVTDEGPASVFQRGLRSARLMSHRAVSQAENMARQAFLDDARQRLPELKKQAIARIDSKTSRTCLAAHGQIKDLDEPFDLRGGFGKAMTPPFHWGPCRTSMTGYMPVFEEGGLKTGDMRAEAREQLEKIES